MRATMNACNVVRIPIFRKGGNGMGTTALMNAYDFVVSAAMGVDSEKVRDLKRKYGSRGLVGVSLHSEAGPYTRPGKGRRQTSPFPDVGGGYRYADPDSPAPDSAARIDDDEEAKEADPVGLRAPKVRPKFPARKK